VARHRGHSRLGRDGSVLAAPPRALAFA
jgi:hypothetical protein